LRAVHGTDNLPKGRGDWGLAARWSPDWLDGTMGFYVRNFTDKLPQVVPVPSARQYVLTYAADIDLYGVSLARQLGGVSVGADLNYRKNMPLVSDSVSAASLAALPTRGNIAGARGNTVHAVVNALASLGASPVWNNASLAAELTYNRWLSVTQGAQFFKGRDSYTNIDKVSKNFLGLAVNFTPTWFQVLPGADLSMPLSYSRGLSGNSAVPFGGNEGTGSYSAGLGLDLYGKYRFDLKYSNYFGDYTTNAAGVLAVPNGTTVLVSDRGALFFTFKTAF
jgi:hypothetical protein